MMETNSGLSAIEQIQLASKSLDDLQQKIIQIESSNNALYETNHLLKKDSNSDWTTSYDYWSKWEDVDEVKEKQKMEEIKLNEIKTRPTFNGHMHDHNVEREFFKKPEDEKMSFCEKHRIMGNHRYEEGNLNKAIEQYKLTLSYYEYCFPDDHKTQIYLDQVRHACYCNLSICFFRQQEYRLSVDYATRAISNSQSLVQNNNEEESNESIHYDKTKNNHKSKAYYRRACAYRALDEYTHAYDDLYIALTLVPQDATLLKELELLRRQEKCAITNQKKMMELAFNHHELNNSGNDKNSNINNTSIHNSNKNCMITSNTSTQLFSVLSLDKPLEPICRLHSTGS